MAEDDAAETWYVRARGRVLGPLSWEQLRNLRERGQLARFDQVSRDRREWQAADGVDRLFPRTGGGGAFVKGPGPGEARAVTRRQPEPDPEPTNFLLLDDDDIHEAAAAPPIDPAAEEPGWYYADAGSPHGPVGYAELKRLARDGRIAPATLIWRSGLDGWTAGSDLPELSRLWPADGASAATGRSAGPDRGQAGEPGRTVEGPRTSPAAVVSVVVNILCFAGNLAAIVVGVIAIRQIARSGGKLRGKALAIAGIALGVVGIVLSAVAASRFVVVRSE